MKIIIGLGNPGKEYEGTRHNIGFAFLDYLSKKYGGIFSFDKKINSEISQVKIEGEKTLLVKPQTFVNKSGEAAGKLIRSLKLKIPDLIVVHDDLDIPFGKTKLSAGRSSAGHRGIDSIIRTLKSDRFYRLRFGTFSARVSGIRKIKNKKKKTDEMGKFVLGRFTPAEKKKLSKIMKEAEQKLAAIL